MNNKERWIGETLEGFSGVEREGMDAALFNRVMNKLQCNAGRVINIRRRTVLQAAAAIGLLVALNAFSVSHFMKSSGAPSQNTTSAFSQEYFSYVNQPATF